MKYIIDANNVTCYGKNKNGGKIHIEYLKAVIDLLVRNRHDWFCFADANIDHIVEENDPAHVQLLTNLMSKYSQKFISVPGGSKADVFILQKADLEGCHIISNDNFREYESMYNWLRNGARVHHFVIADGLLQIPDVGCLSIEGSRISHSQMMEVGKRVVSAKDSYVTSYSGIQLQCSDSLVQLCALNAQLGELQQRKQELEMQRKHAHEQSQTETEIPTSAKIAGTLVLGTTIAGIAYGLKKLFDD